MSTPQKAIPSTYHTLIGRMINDAAFRADLTSGDEHLSRRRLAEVGITNPSSAMLKLDATTLQRLTKAFDAGSENVAN